MANVKSLVKKQIRLDVVFSIIWARRRNYLIPVGTTLIAFYLLMCCVPRYYSVKVMLAPEYETSSAGGGGLSSLASMANINLGSLGGSSDAITPTIYPDLMKSTDFIVPLFDVKVTTSDGKFAGPYSTYLKEACKAPWWDMAMMYVGSLISSKDEEGGTGEAQRIDPFHLTKKQKEMADAISAGIACTVDKKTDVISITTTAQDPLVAAQLADTIRERLQNFITEYRTHKARIELNHMHEIANNAYLNYMKKQKEYADYCDSHQDLVLEVYKAKAENLENELQLAFNAYSGAKTQETVAQAKVLSKTPAFTTLQNATVPLRPAGPKRMMFAIVMAMLCFLVQTVYFVAKDVKKMEVDNEA